MYFKDLLLIIISILLIAMSLIVIDNKAHPKVVEKIVYQKQDKIYLEENFTKDDARIILNAKFRNNNPEKAIQIAECESNLTTNYINVSQYPFKYGLFQLQPSKENGTPDELLNIIYQTELVYKLTEGGKNWKVLNSKCILD